LIWKGDWSDQHRTLSTSGGSQGLGFAIPSNMVRTIVESVVSNKPLIRPWIGLSGRSVPPQAASSLGLPPGKGVLVTETYKGGPAEAAGLGIGDVVISLDGFPVNEFQALRYRIATRSAGGAVNLTIVRQGRFVSVPVAWSRRPMYLLQPDVGTEHESAWVPGLPAYRPH
jgi:S1-C subfamily serine protease